VDGINTVLLNNAEDTVGILRRKYYLENKVNTNTVKDFELLDIDPNDDPAEINTEVLNFVANQEKIVKNLEEDMKRDDWNQNHLRDLFDRPNEPLRMKTLKYWALYPKKVRRWVTYSKSTKGFYNEWGRWVPVEDLTSFHIPKEKDKESDEVTKWDYLYNQEQSKLDDLYKGKYRFGIKPEEIKDKHPKVKLLFSFANATEKEKTIFRKQQFVQKYKEKEFDTGSSGIQVAMLTIRIRNLIDHLKKNKKDTHNKRNLQILVSRRKSLMRCLKRDNVEKYYQLLMELKLADSVENFK